MATMTANSPPTFQPLPGIYEPSAVQQLPDGRFLVIEDEKQHPFSLITLNPGGQIDSVPLGPQFLELGDSFWKLNDLEGLAMDQAGNLYAITSHSRNSDGEEKKSRDKLVRFRIEGDRVTEPRVENGLKPALLAAHPVLAEAAGLLDVKAEGGLNIEAMEVSADQQGLLIGFRGPLLDGRALMARVENLAELFEADAPPRVSNQLVTLDLGGQGIRGMAYVPHLGGHLLISGPVGREPVPFQLWFWSSQPDDAARRVSVPGLAGFKHAEGVCAAVLEGQPWIIIVSDDGDRMAGRPAHYLLLDPAQLQVGP
jgi:hypothetical protein